MTFRPGQRLVIPGVQVFQPRVTSAAASGILDGISNVAAAYSLRKLRSAYAGSAVRVRRSSDSTEQDIGFDGTGEFDSAAFSSFIGGGTGYVKTWYDQGANGKDIAQSTTSLQPSIALSGINSKPSVLFGGGYLSGALSLTTSACAFLAAVAETSAVQYAGFLVAHAGSADDYSSANNFVLEAAAAATGKDIQFNRNFAAAIGPSGSKPTPAAIYSVVNSPSTTMRKNGASVATGTNTNSGASTTLLLGARFLSGNISVPYRLIGYESEIIILSAAISAADHNTIGADMATRYGLSWTTVT